MANYTDDVISFYITTNKRYPKLMKMLKAWTKKNKLPTIYLSYPDIRYVSLFFDQFCIISNIEPRYLSSTFEKVTYDFYFKDLGIKDIIHTNEEPFYDKQKCEIKLLEAIFEYTNEKVIK